MRTRERPRQQQPARRLQPAPSRPWAAWTWKLTIALWVLAAVSAALSALVAGTDFTSPLDNWVHYVGTVFAGSSALFVRILSHSDRASEHPAFVFCVAATAVVLYFVFAGLHYLLGTPWQVLTADVPARVEIEGGGQALLRFTVDPGDHTAVVIDAITPGLAISAIVENGERTESVGEASARRWVYQGVLVGGDWTLTITNEHDQVGAVRVRYGVTNRATPLQVGQVLRGQTVGTADTRNGYVIEPTEGVEARLIVDELSGDDLALSVAVWRGTRRDNPPTAPRDGAYVVPIVLQPDQQYVVSVSPLDGATGRYRLALLEDSSPDVPEPPPAPGPSERVALPPLYDIPEGEAHALLGEAGLVAESLAVCSSSVAAGQVRQAFVLSEGGEETVVADRPGLVPAGMEVTADTVVRLKVSTGQPCT
jgi:hypothetical protein